MGLAVVSSEYSDGSSFPSVLSKESIFNEGSFIYSQLNKAKFVDLGILQSLFPQTFLNGHVERGD